MKKLQAVIKRFLRHRELDRMPLFLLCGKILRMAEKNAIAQERSLDDLDRVLIITTDKGPFVCDRFLTLVFHDHLEWSIPLENPSYQNFYDALSNALPLNDEQALLAAFSIVNALFPLWEREHL